MHEYQRPPLSVVLKRLWARRLCIVHGHSWVPWGVDFPDHYVWYIDECHRCGAKRNRRVLEC